MCSGLCHCRAGCPKRSGVVVGERRRARAGHLVGGVVPVIGGRRAACDGGDLLCAVAREIEGVLSYTPVHSPFSG